MMKLPVNRESRPSKRASLTVWSGQEFARLLQRRDSSLQRIELTAEKKARSSQNPDSNHAWLRFPRPAPMFPKIRI